MEKLLTTEERIRRAEEIYERRRGQHLGTHTATVNINHKKNVKLLKKIVLQMLVCIILYYIIFWIQHSSNLLSTENVEPFKQILSYDINFQEIYRTLQSEIVKRQNKEESMAEQSNELETNQVLQEETLSATDTSSSEEITEEVKEPTQMEQDAKSIKEMHSLTKPVEGQISSMFGQRESQNPIVSKNHSGIDVSAKEGTKIKAAMEGEVILATHSSTYRKLYSNSKWRGINTLCTLQNFICNSRRKGCFRTRNCRSRSYRKCNRTASTF